MGANNDGMDIVRDIEQYTAAEPTAIALGTFDGVHIGHRAVISAAAQQQGLMPAAFAFERSPAGLLESRMVRALTTPAIKARLLEQLGVQLLITPEFSAVQQLTPREFVLLLRERFHARALYCGFNFTFGRGGEGNAALLRELCRELGMQASVLPPVVDSESDGLPVSSTRIRELIAQGEIERANALLGYEFGYDFTVIQGDHRGRRLNFPTINQRLEQNFAAPKNGVYASKTQVNGDWYRSITNIGVRPTVGSAGLGSETYIFDYSGVLYGERPWVRLFSYLRPEQRFADEQELKAAVERDIASVREMKY